MGQLPDGSAIEGEAGVLEREAQSGEFSNGSKRVMLEACIGINFPQGGYPDPYNFILTEEDNGNVYLISKDSSKGYAIVKGDMPYASCFDVRDKLKSRVQTMGRKVLRDFGDAYENIAGFYWEAKR
jgi:hypothetical protein